MRTGFLASAIAVFISTPSHPSSIAIVASEAVPTPASTMTGLVEFSKIISMLYGFVIPKPEPIGAARGIIETQPISSSSLHNIGSSVQ